MQRRKRPLPKSEGSKDTNASSEEVTVDSDVTSSPEADTESDLPKSEVAPAQQPPVIDLTCDNSDSELSSTSGAGPSNATVIQTSDTPIVIDGDNDSPPRTEESRPYRYSPVVMPLPEHSPDAALASPEPEGAVGGAGISNRFMLQRTSPAEGRRLRHPRANENLLSTTTGAPIAAPAYTEFLRPRAFIGYHMNGVLADVYEVARMNGENILFHDEFCHVSENANHYPMVRCEGVCPHNFSLFMVQVPSLPAPPTYPPQHEPLLAMTMDRYGGMPPAYTFMVPMQHPHQAYGFQQHPSMSGFPEGYYHPGAPVYPHMIPPPAHVQPMHLAVDYSRRYPDMNPLHASRLEAQFRQLEARRQVFGRMNEPRHRTRNADENTGAGPALEHRPVAPPPPGIVARHQQRAPDFRLSLPATRQLLRAPHDPRQWTTPRHQHHQHAATVIFDPNFASSSISFHHQASPGSYMPSFTPGNRILSPVAYSNTGMPIMGPELPYPFLPPYALLPGSPLTIQVEVETPGMTSEQIEGCTIRYKYVIQTKTTERTVSASDNADRCAICLVDFEVDDDMRRLTCLHEFHQACVDRWFQSSVRCPMCRVDVRARGEAGSRSTTTTRDSST